MVDSKSGVKGGAKPAKKNTYGDLGAILKGGGLSDLVKPGDRMARIPMAQILVTEQVRKQFERDGESTMEEMTASVKKHGVIQPALFRPIDGPGPFKFELVCGGRRYRASKNNDLPDMPGVIREMTDAEASELQFVENIHRLNLSQLEEAQRVQDDLDAANGDVDVVLAKYTKGRSWLSKILSLLTLPTETARLILDGVTADVEVVNNVKQIEKVNPQAAKEAVEHLKATKNKEDARQVSKDLKAQVKPPKAKAKKDAAGVAATAKDTTQLLPGVAAVESFADAKNAGNDSAGNGEKVVWPFGKKEDSPASDSGALLPAAHLDKIFGLITDGSQPEVIVDVMTTAERDGLEAWLKPFYLSAANNKDYCHALLEGMRAGTFGIDGYSAFQMIAFLQGADPEIKAFSLVKVFRAVKP
ncbi:ParB/RepB/Spo0J family partition protein [Janthinobacterium sp. FW305-128]|uniref:ParB/RepB/Spo0J family partition protein n=1 Tax=Janthinobacterium sp. FW305-128 TaxID=2775055 RepID=UPI001E57373B|nr:ParB/RepB/Spo0J family partition protein [Janthinobacterium sp. FW305-128]MCC7684733.1 ParB/RepB/Spo0J family partition protein [Janthinobacterium sp. FW305-128]